MITALLVACGGESGGGSPARSARMAESVAESSSSGLGYRGAAQEPGGGAEAKDPAMLRKLIQNAELHLEVESCDDARRAIEADLARVGGYLSSANISHREGRVSRAVLVLRIPATTLGSALETYAKLGTVVRESLTTQDITEEYFDLEARLANARKLEARLHELLTTQTEDLKDLLEVERELARVRETIERFEGKLRLWGRQVALSTLTVELTTRKLYVAAVPSTLGEQISQTLSGSWHALVTVGRALVLAAVAILPWVIPLLLLGWLFVRLVRRLERRMAAKSRARQATRAAQQQAPPAGVK